MTWQPINTTAPGPLKKIMRNMRWYDWLLAVFVAVFYVVTIAALVVKVAT